MGLRTLTEDLSYITEQHLSHRGPTTIRLWMKVGMMCPWQKVSFSRGVAQDDNNLCACPVSVPNTTGGTFMLRSPQGNSLFIYMPLAPAYAIAMSLW